MSSVPQIRDRLGEVFPTQQADALARVVGEAHDDLVTRGDFFALTAVVRELAEAQTRTETKVAELAEAQKRTETKIAELADAQKRSELRIDRLAEAIAELTETQRQMLIRLDDVDGRSLEHILARRLPSYVGLVFRKCRVIDTADLIDAVEGRVPEAALADLLRTDIVATANHAGQPVHLVVEVSRTGHSSDVHRAARRAATLTSAGLPAVGMVACARIGAPAAAHAQVAGVRVLVNGKFRSEAA
ncbi:MAG: hypothetical protein ACKO6B_11745 [Planctomycetia bacterium]